MGVILNTAGGFKRPFLGPASSPSSGGGSGGDIAAFRFNTVNATRGDTQVNLLAAFTQWDSLTSEPFDNCGGWVYTDTYTNLDVPAPPSGNTRGLVQEFFPVAMFPGGAPGDFQPNPYLQWGTQSDPDGTLPANFYVRWWIYCPSTFDADIGSGTQTFTATWASRDKSMYPSRASSPDPLYPATFADLNWDFLQGSNGYEGTNNHIGVPSMPSNECFIGLDTSGESDGTGRANNPLAISGQEFRLYQNLNNTTGKIVQDTWTEVTMHFDTSGASGVWEAWIKKQGVARVKVAEWIEGVTTGGFTWTLPADQRVGHKAFQLNSVVNGTGTGGVGDHRYIYDTIDLATTWANLPEYDP